MSIYNLADEIARHILNAGDLDIDAITRQYTPNAIGSTSYGWTKPHPVSLPGPVASEYVNYCGLNLDGIGEWVEIMRILRDKHKVDLNSLDYNLFQIAAKNWLYCNTSAYYVPVITLSVSESRSKTNIRYVGMTEYMEIFKFTDVGLFFNHVIQIILFGFPFTTYYTDDVFKIQSAMAYFASRLFQGNGDLYVMLSTGNRRQPSAFVNPDDLDPEPDLSEPLSNMSVGLSMSGIAKRQKMYIEMDKQAIRTLLNKGHFTNVNSELMTALARTNMFSLDAEYEHYLKRSSPFSKASIELWYTITHAGNPEPSQNAETFTAFESASSTNNYTGIERNPMRI
jgi:hypothetical protein